MVAGVDASAGPVGDGSADGGRCVVGVGAVALCEVACLSGVGDGSLKVAVSDIAGKAENGPSGLPPRLMGGLPRVLPLDPAPLRHADETTFAPWRLVDDRGLDGVMADLGSLGSAQNAFRVTGVMAECG